MAITGWNRWMIIPVKLLGEHTTLNERETEEENMRRCMQPTLNMKTKVGKTYYKHNMRRSYNKERKPQQARRRRNNQNKEYKNNFSKTTRFKVKLKNGYRDIIKLNTLLDRKQNGKVINIIKTKGNNNREQTDLQKLIEKYGNSNVILITERRKHLRQLKKLKPHLRDNTLECKLLIKIKREEKLEEWREKTLTAMLTKRMA